MSEINSQFFDEHIYAASDFVESNKNTMKDGVLPDLNYFNVLPASNMTIGVTAGRGWVQGHAFSSDSTLSFILDSADGVLDRVDTVVIRLDLTTDNEKIECKVVKGALGGNAAAPVRNGTYYDLVIAQIAVAHGTTAITADMITDKRGDGNLCGWSGAISGDQFNFDGKADKTYCDDTFTTKAAMTAYQLTITNGTTKTNADRLQGKAISATAPTAGQVLQFNGTQYAPTTCGYVSGVYTGNESIPTTSGNSNGISTGQKITLGFKPRALFIYASVNSGTASFSPVPILSDQYNAISSSFRDGSQVYGGITTDGTSPTITVSGMNGLYWVEDLFTLDSDGFTVRNKKLVTSISTTNTYGYINNNMTGYKYRYIAFR